MDRRKRKDSPFDMFLPRTSTAELRGRQSVRATFKLTAGSIEAISIVASQLGIKQKSLFDHLIENSQALRSIAQGIRQREYKKQNRVQKTYVISRRTLYLLDEVSKDFDASRDALVEYSVQRLMPLITREQKKHTQRKKIQKEIGQHFEDGRMLLKRARSSLGDEDPILDRLESVMRIYAGTKNAIDAFIEKGKIIENYKVEDLVEGLKSALR